MAGLDIVLPLSGEEVIADVLDQIGKKLRTDCNMRSSDAYSGGYDAVISIKLNLYGVDRTQVEVTTAIGEPKEDPDAVVVDEELKIDREQDLNEVRERSEQGVPVTSVSPEGEPITKKRSFARKQAVGMAI